MVQIGIDIFWLLCIWYSECLGQMDLKPLLWNTNSDGYVHSMQSWMPLQKCWTEKCTKRAQDQAINKSFWGSGCRIMYTNRRFFADILCNNYHPVLYELWDSLGQKVSLSILHSSIQLDSFKTMENESLLQRGVDFSLLPDNVHAFIKNGGELTPDNDKSWKIVQKILFSGI